MDPREHGLFFQRFLHAEREDLPDIDLDFPSHRRDEMLDWVFRHLGPSRCAMVGVWQTYQLRSALREGLKALGMTAAEVERFSRRIPDAHLTEAEIVSLQGRPDPYAVPYHVLPQAYRDKVPLLQQLVGKPAHLSVHPGGVVIGPEPLGEHVPLERAPKGVFVTQYDLRGVEQAGLVKIDLLGNRFLSELAETHPGPIPENDAATLQRIDEARTLGCFQLESPAMRSVLQRLPVRSFSDVVAALALVRPGPGAGEAKARFVRRARGEEAPSPPHPALTERLRGTYGVPLYEEDIMAILSTLGGVSLETADAWRERIVRGHAEQVRPQFLAAGGPPEVWEWVVRFAAYSFNKAHATSYGLLAYQAAYLKTHHLTRFACALLNHHAGVYPLRTLVADLQRDGVRFLPPDVNRSHEECVLEKDSVRIGLATIKHLSRRGREALLARRPFHEMQQLRSLNRRDLEALVLSGACDGVAPLSALLYPFAHEAFLAGSPPAAGVQVDPSEQARLQTYRTLVRIRNELRFLEMHLVEHPLRVLRPEATRVGCLDTLRVQERPGERVRLVALVAATRRVLTRGGAPLQFVTLEDEFGLLEATLAAGLYTRLDNPIANPGPFLLEGTLIGAHRLHIRKVQPFHERPQSQAHVPPES